MKTDESLSRAVRLARIPHLLHIHPQGLTTKELAGICGVSCRTIQRDIISLQSGLRLPVYEKDSRYQLLGDYILPPVSFSLFESVALFLASRLAVRQTDENNLHLRNALSKLAGILPYPLEEKVRSAVNDIGNKRGNAEFIQTFERLAFAWMAQRKVIMEYSSLNSSETRLWELEPYFMETTGVGYSCYVIGHAVRPGKDGIITFKLDRIKKVRLMDENFEIPAGVDIEKLLSGSWGVIWGNDIEVVLKFSPGVTRRVKESVWHSSQRITNLPDGGCRLKLKVGSTMEITPWIRGWGADVEVLEPAELREKFKGWAEKLKEMYH